MSLQNAQKLLGQYGEPFFCGVRLIDTGGFLQNCARLPSIHGADGMGDLFKSPERNTPALPYAEWKNEPPESGATVLSLGPCTVALDAVKRLSFPETVIMAGVVFEKPNYKGMEFNQALDAQAFNALVKMPHTAATLDTCRVPAFNLAGARVGTGTVLGKLLNRANELAELRHPGRSYIYDLIAALYLIEPEIFEVQKTADPFGNELNELRLKDGSFSLKEYLEKG